MEYWDRDENRESDEIRLKKLLDDMIADLSDNANQQKSLHRDFKREKFINFLDSKHDYIDKIALRINSN